MEQPTVITSKDNSLIRRYRRICEDKRYRNTEHVFAAEGLRLVCEALQEGHCASLYVTESACAKYADELRDGITKPYIISDALGKYLSETEHPQGVFALCYTTKRELEDTLKPDGRYLVLYELQDPGNMGMILRTADAFGIDAVLTYQCCDIYNPKVVRATMGAIFRIPVIDYVPPASHLRLYFEEKGIRSFAAVLHKDARPVTECSLGRGCAVWIGNEGNGLSPEAVEACEEKLIIPMPGNAESLNAAMAAGILMWEMTKAGEQ